MSKPSITHQIESHVRSAIDAFSLGETVEWVVIPALGPQGQITHFVTVVTPSPLLGKSIQAGGVMIGAEVNGETISGLIQEALEHCRSKRTEVLSGALEASAPDHTELLVPH
jgi:hypothetical protein